jgi:CBS domain containing-hemolysin-like protein
MFRLLIGPMIAGMMAFVSVYFISPVIISGPGIVSISAEFVLRLSTFYFENTPSIIAGYIANLNLLMVALTAGLLVMVVMQLFVIIWSLFSGMARWMISFLKKGREEDEPQDLPPIDMDSSFKTSSIGKGVFGRGLDSIDRNL